MKRLLTIALVLGGALALGLDASAQSTLKQINDELVALAKKLGPCVVDIRVEASPEPVKRVIRREAGEPGIATGVQERFLRPGCWE